MTSSVRAVTAARHRALSFWTHRARELEAAETKLHDALKPEIAKVIHGKNLKVFSEMLTTTGFPNVDSLIHLMATGFPVAGTYPTTGVFHQLNESPPCRLKTCGVTVTRSSRTSPAEAPPPTTTSSQRKCST